MNFFTGALIAALMFVLGVLMLAAVFVALIKLVQFGERVRRRYFYDSREQQESLRARVLDRLNQQGW